MSDRFHYAEMRRRVCAGCGCDFETTVRRRRLCRQCAWVRAERWGHGAGDRELQHCYDPTEERTAVGDGGF